MAFAFIVEDGSMVTDSNSYISVADATDYLAANIHASATWTALTTLAQEQLLVWASRHLDQRATWNGIPTSQYLGDPTGTNFISGAPVFSTVLPVPAQSMRWPRVGVEDVDGRTIASDVIPPALANAVAEMARFLMSEDRTVERPQDFLTELKVEGITLRFRDSVLSIVPPEVSYILRGLGTISNGRTNFAKIRRA